MTTYGMKKNFFQITYLVRASYPTIYKRLMQFSRKENQTTQIIKVAKEE